MARLSTRKPTNAAIATGIATISFLAALGVVAASSQRATSTQAESVAFDPRALSIVDPSEPAPPIDTSHPFWYEPYVQTDTNEPRHPSVIGGIGIGRASRSTEILPCPTDQFSFLDGRELRGSSWDESLPKAKYLPAGATLAEEEAVLCSGQLVWYSIGYTLPADDKQLKLVADGKLSWFDVPHGGFVHVTLNRTDSPALSIVVPDKRLSEGHINSSAVVIGAPVLKAGFGDAFAATWDGSEMLTVSTMHLPLTELMKIAQGVMK